MRYMGKMDLSVGRSYHMEWRTTWLEHKGTFQIVKRKTGLRQGWKVRNVTTGRLRFISENQLLDAIPVTEQGGSDV